jgi:glutamine synthetase
VDRAGRNALVDRDAHDGLSALARHAIAGLLAHLPALCAVTAPSANSYRRLVPTAWAGAWRCWGYDNREAAVRSCSPIRGEQERSTNIEYKPSDASSSPYMTLGALIAAALDGIERELAPPAPVAVDPATMSDAERDAAGIEALPRTPAEALDALEADEVLSGALGEPLARSFVAVRRAEWAYYETAGEEVELADHLQRY